MKCQRRRTYRRARTKDAANTRPTTAPATTRNSSTWTRKLTEQFYAVKTDEFRRYPLRMHPEEPGGSETPPSPPASDPAEGLDSTFEAGAEPDPASGSSPGWQPGIPSIRE